MAKVIPFKGIYYNQERISDLSLVLTPPYDVISGEEQKRLYQSHEYNFIRIILGKEESGDGQGKNNYIRAASYLKDWLREGLLLEDKSPSIYVYTQQFCLSGKHFERTGLVALLRLEEFGQGAVYPHERTLPNPKRDRLKLLQTTRANTEPIFLLYEDQDGKIRKEFAKIKREIPMVDIEYTQGERHRLWASADELLIARIQREMEGKSLYIADGHHRYEASLHFRDNEKSPYEYIMAYMVDLDDEGLMILPAHRLIRNFERRELEKIEERIREYFVIRQIPTLDKLLRELKDWESYHTFGWYQAENFYLLLLKEEDFLDEINDANPYTRRLDVTILHNLILGMESKAEETEDKINYTTSGQEAIELVDRGDYQMAFLLNPAKVHQVKDVALSGGVMPGKATYFYPKPLSGLIINKF